MARRQPSTGPTTDIHSALYVTLTLGLLVAATLSYAHRWVPLDQLSRNLTHTRVHINSDRTDTLCLLPGIGPSLSARIVAGRPYMSTAQLDQVKGIGPRTLERIAPFILIDEVPGDEVPSID